MRPMAAPSAVISKKTTEVMIGKSRERVVEPCPFIVKFVANHANFRQITHQVKILITTL